MKIPVCLPICIGLILLGCSSRSGDTEAIRLAIARDMLGRVGDHFTISFGSPDADAEKLLRESAWERVDLDYDHEAEYIVHFNWYDDSGTNLVRGMQGNGRCYAYRAEAGRPVFLGSLDGRHYSVLLSHSHGFRDIETENHLSHDKSFIAKYCYDGHQYKQVSHGVYRFEAGRRTLVEELEIDE
jgi:hypothetical protein